MNTELAKAIAEVIRNRWNSRELHSKEIYQELVGKNMQVPKGDMAEILVTFQKAGVINVNRYKHTTAVDQHGHMAIVEVNFELLDQLDFD